MQAKKCYLVVNPFLKNALFYLLKVLLLLLKMLI